jgi:DNA helicase II / ATP-dependent DNA helicase PcrA
VGYTGLHGLRGEIIMTQSSIDINSGDVLTDVEHHFRVTAGPGAGKTFWLAQHIKQVVGVSRRLTPCSRIATISYTNVAIREILGRLGAVADRVDVSTIHSFLFRNIVRPYLHLLKDAEGQDLVAHHLVDTHDVHYPRYDKVNAWVLAAGKGQILAGVPSGAKERLLDQLRTLTVHVDAAGNPTLAPCKIEPRDRSLQVLLHPESLVKYKMQYWREGILDHEDVLYCACRLMVERPTLRRFMSDRFPYLFIDEFQDTIPAQEAFVRWLAMAGTVIGVIGDPEQAIYGFLDARPEHFREFQLDSHKSYTISGNRRSTKAIVDVLNLVRTDGLEQDSIRKVQGVVPLAYTGSLVDALAHAKQSVPAGTALLVLARKHATVMQARLQAGGQLSDPWETLLEADEYRCRFLLHVATALDLAHRQLFDLAVQRIVHGLSNRIAFRKPLTYDGPIDVTVRRSFALSILEHLMDQHARLLSATALDFYNTLFEYLPTCLDGIRLPAVRGGKFGNAASACRYLDLFHALHTPDETRAIRTIHQAKGAEAPAVFVVLDDGQTGHILQPSANDEEQRITYVALSRAQDYLFIFCPSRERIGGFSALGMDTHELGSPPVLPRQASRRQRGNATK